MPNDLKRKISGNLMSAFMPFLPKNELSHWVGRIVHKQIPGPIGSKSVKFFAKYYNIDLNEAEHPVEHYKSIGELFTRRLKPGLRPIGEGIVHPADAVITEAGQIQNQTLIQAKGKTYTVTELLRGTHFSADFEAGQFMTYYLCPTDYHRVHSPVDGEVVWSCHVPGELWPVNDWSVNAIHGLFATNERVITIIQAKGFKVAVVMVAATNVGNMTMAFDSEICTHTRKSERKPRDHAYAPPVKVKRGDELGVFNMGSTVVMLVQKGAPRFDEAAYRGMPVKMGASLNI
jgi:phosphatidylserine decarboxylase